MTITELVNKLIGIRMNHGDLPIYLLGHNQLVAFPLDATSVSPETALPNPVTTTLRLPARVELVAVPVVPPVIIHWQKAEDDG